jgi:hypothetical protein
VLNLADYGRIRVAADRLSVDKIDREGRFIVITFRPQTRVDAMRLVQLVRQRADLRLMPPSGLRMNLDQAPRPEPEVRAAKAGGKKGAPEGSWWTARARAGEVTPGFDRETITRKKAEDPRAEGGVLERVTELLEVLG